MWESISERLEFFCIAVWWRNPLPTQKKIRRRESPRRGDRAFFSAKCKASWSEKWAICYQVCSLAPSAPEQLSAKLWHFAMAAIAHTWPAPSPGGPDSIWTRRHRHQKRPATPQAMTYILRIGVTSPLPARKKL